MIEVRELSKTYGDVRALGGVSLSAQNGRVTGLLGPNACGKTTLIKSILGLVVPDSGEVLIDGLRTRSDGKYRDQIGYLPQNPGFPSNLTLTELLDMLVDVRCRPAPARETLVDTFQLAPVLERPLGTLSGGTRQKVGVVVAFMFEPSILILDEPTVGLDPIAAVRLKDLVRQSVAAGRTVLLVSHILSEIEQLVDDVTFLLEGRALWSGSMARLFEVTSATRLDDALIQLTRGEVRA